MNLLGVPTLVLEMGQGHDIHRSFGNQIVDGIFHIMSEMGIWTGPEPKVQEPAISVTVRWSLSAASQTV